jgi:hypothetical protein
MYCGRLKVTKNTYFKSTSISKGIIVIITNYTSRLSSAAIEMRRCTVAELSPDE